MIYLAYKHDAVPNEAKGKMDYLVLDYLKSMIGSMINARLNELQQSPQPPFIYAMAQDGNFLLSKTKDAFTGVVVSKEDGISTALASLVREIERIHQFGFTASEYARAKADYLRRLESAYNERNKVKNNAYVNEYVRHFIDNEPIPGIEAEYAVMNQMVPNIPVEAVNALLPTLVTDSNIVVNVFCPEKEGMKYPAEQEILDVINQVKAEKLEPYEDKVSDEPLLSETPKAGTIVKTEEGPFGSTALTLSNGIRVILKTTDFKADEIRMRAFSPGGSSLFPDTDILQIKVMNAVAGLGGLGNFSNVDLEKVLAGKKVGVSAYVNGLSEGLDGNCSPKDLETLMQLVYLSFTALRMDQDAFESYKNRTKAALANQEANPMIALTDTLQKAMYMDHPRSMRLKADMVDRIDYNKIMEMYKDRFKEAGDFTFLFVGNIDIEKAKPLIETYLGGLPTIQRTENFRDTKMDIRKGEYKNIFSKQMETPKATVLMIESGKCDYTLKNDILMNMLSQALNMVYLETVREKEGGSYGVSAYGQLSRYPKEDEALLQIYFDTDPAKREKMMQIITDELQKMAKEGPRLEHLSKVKEFMLKKHTEQIKENNYWLGMLNQYYWYKSDMDTNYEQLVNSLTAQDVRKFAEDLLKQGNSIKISMTSEGQKQ